MHALESYFREYFSAEMGQLAAESALKDAGVDYGQVQAVAASYCYGDPTSGKYGLLTAYIFIVDVVCLWKV